MARKPSIISNGTLSDHLFAGIHGDPGVGKSRLIGTTRGRVLIIHARQSHLNSLLPADKARMKRGEIEEARPNDWDDMAELQTYLRQDGEVYDFVWIDDIQTLFEVLLDDLWDTVIIEKPARARFGLDKAEYGINMERLSRWIRHTIGPDKFHFGFVAHSEPAPSPDKDRDGDPIVKLMPWIQGKGMPQKFSGYMNVVGYLTTTEVKGRDEPARVLRTSSSANWYAKDQFDAFNGRVLDPDMGKILDLIEKSGGLKPEPNKTKTATRSPGRRTVARRKR